VEKLIDIQGSPAALLLDLLLKDKSTKKNIIWAADTYEKLDHGFSDKEQINRSLLLQHADIIKPRIRKSQEVQQERTRKKAEVFTPAWLCNLMNNYCDKEWFGRKNVFNAEKDDHTWTVVEEPIEFPKRKTWKHYVDSRRLEITCGEAPYLVSRYDVSTGELIVPPKRRIGQLDRKLRIVNENAADYEEWVKWTIRAFEASYGYEYQGDNLLIARINLLLTFIDYYKERWGKEPDEKLLRTVVNKIVWNIWQMDGLKDTVPLGKPYEKFRQLTLFDMYSEMADNEPETIPCKIYDWRRDNSIFFNKLKEMKVMGHKLFNFVIGNPPYQEEFSSNGNKTYAAPVYNYFMDAVDGIAQRAELIHPARFLFNAGSTPKAWNQKMLEDPHFKVLKYEEDATKVFPNTDIKGGIAVTYHDETKDYGAIRVFTKYDELNSILRKVTKQSGFKSMDEIVVTRTAYRLTDKMHDDHPEARYKEDENGNNIGMLSKGHDYDMSTNIFDRLPQIFFDKSPDDGNKYIRVLGRKNNQRVYKYVKEDYVNETKNLHKYKLYLPSGNGNGQYGETLSSPIVSEPDVAATETFISIGTFDTEYEANSLLKYISSKFARALLGVLKITQHLTPTVWKYVPLQDFTSASDIDWSKSVHEIDLQLYRKYGLDEKEINFIETHVKEMA